MFAECALQVRKYLGALRIRALELAVAKHGDDANDVRGGLCDIEPGRLLVEHGLLDERDAMLSRQPP
jgi:hypothetical protein